METQIQCQVHQDCFIQYIFLMKNNIKYGCVECIQELQDENQNVNFRNIFLLHDIKNSPQKILSKISNIDDQNQQFYNRLHSKNAIRIIQTFQTWENNMRSFQKQIDSLILKQREIVDNLIKAFNNTIEQITQEINFEEFQNLIQEFRTVNEKLYSDVQEQISEKINNYFENLDKNNVKVLNESLKRIRQDYINQVENLKQPNIEDFQNSFEQLVRSTKDLHQQMEKSFNLNNSMNSTIIPNSYFRYLIGNIQQKVNQNIREIKLLYLGSRDGLNGYSLWDKIDEKKNLIFIFKSKNDGNKIFGSYISCRISQNLNNWQSDESLSSFIFSYTHNEIYPLKESEKQHAILCLPSTYAVWIGMSGNIGICNDFINGQSYLGSSYQWDKFENKRSSYLFGGDKPNIEECEVYELLI